MKAWNPSALARSCAAVAENRLEHPNEGQSPAKGIIVVSVQRSEYVRCHLSSSQPTKRKCCVSQIASRRLPTEETLLDEMRGSVEITGMKTGIGCGRSNRRWKVGKT